MTLKLMRNSFAAAITKANTAVSSLISHVIESPPTMVAIVNTKTPKMKRIEQ